MRQSLADKAQELNSELPLVFMPAIVITMQNEGIPVKEWLRDVEKQYEKALKLDPKTLNVTTVRCLL